MNPNQPETTIVEIETRGEMRKRARRERDAARRAANRKRKSAAEEPRPDENILRQPGGTTSIEIETRGEMRKRARRERETARRAQKLRSRECQSADANEPLHVRIMDNDFREATEKHATWPQPINEEVARRAL